MDNVLFGVCEAAYVPRRYSMPDSRRILADSRMLIPDALCSQNTYVLGVPITEDKDQANIWHWPRSPIVFGGIFLKVMWAFVCDLFKQQDHR